MIAGLLPRWRSGLGICLPMQVIQETQVWSLDGEDLLEKEMATCSRILAWKIPWTEEPGGLQSWGCKESDVTKHVCAHTQTHTVVATIILVTMVLHYRALAITGSPSEFLHLHMDSSSLGSGRAATSWFRQGLCALLLEQVIWNRHFCVLSFLWPYYFVGLTQCVSSLHPTLIFFHSKIVN